MQAQDVINSARLIATPWGQGPLPVALMQLITYVSNLDRDAAQKIAKVAPHILAVAGTPVDIVKADNAAGYQLEAGMRYLDFSYEDENNQLIPIRVVALHKQDHPGYNPAGILLVDRFIPVDPLRKRWADISDGRAWYNGQGERVHYKRIVTPAVATSMTSTLVTPDFARPYFELETAVLLMMLNRAPVDTIQKFQAMALEARKQLSLTIQSYAPVQAAFGEEEQQVPGRSADWARVVLSG